MQAVVLKPSVDCGAQCPMTAESDAPIGADMRFHGRRDSYRRDWEDFAEFR